MSTWVKLLKYLIPSFCVEKLAFLLLLMSLLMSWMHQEKKGAIEDFFHMLLYNILSFKLTVTRRLSTT